MCWSFDPDGCEECLNLKREGRGLSFNERLLCARPLVCFVPCDHYHHSYGENVTQMGKLRLRKVKELVG